MYATKKRSSYQAKARGIENTIDDKNIVDTETDTLLPGIVDNNEF